MLEKRFTAKEEAFYRRLTLPEDDPRKYPLERPNRSYRWFRSRNVVPIEHYRRPARAVLTKSVTGSR